MQVSHASDHITHAVVGGHKSIDMGISSSAEFFNILSSTLYTNQILAVVRETICNAWDAHIEAGKKDVPIQITVADNKLIIRDFGNGIHHDDFGPIYGVYGNSTKKNDASQTGGFGLGCKAPYAYVDTFQVTSMNDGVKTIYSINKSSAEVGGKPSITPILSIPTSESGLEVVIELKTHDINNFKNEIGQVVFFGDIKAELNKMPMENLNMGTEKGAFSLVFAASALTKSNIYIRYGNVIYPLDNHPAYDKNYSRILRHFNKIVAHDYIQAKSNLILQAEPDSITVTPSRESLSMQAKTVATAEQLIDAFLSKLVGTFKNEGMDIVRKNQEDAIKIDPWLAVDYRYSLINLDQNSRDCVNKYNTRYVINNFTTLATELANFDYPASSHEQKIELLKDALLAVADQTINPAALRNVVRKHKTGSLATEILTKVIVPTMVRLCNKAGLSLDNLRINDPKRELSNYAYSEKQYITSLDGIVVGTRIKYLFNLLNRKIKVSTNLNELAKSESGWIYKLSRKQQTRNDEISLFESMSSWEADLTKPDVIVRSPRSTIRTKSKSKPKNAFICANSALNSSGNVNLLRLYDTSLREDIQYISNPEWYFATRKEIVNDDSSCVISNDITASSYFLNNYGDKGAITLIKPQREKCLQIPNIKTAYDYFVDVFYASIDNDPKILEAYAIRNAADYFSDELSEVYKFSRSVRLIFNALIKFDSFLSKVGLTINLTDEQETLLSVLANRINRKRNLQGNELTKINTLLTKLNMPANLVTGYNLIASSLWVPFVDAGMIRHGNKADIENLIASL